MKVAALDDAAWGSPWRRHRVGEKVALSLGLVLTALLAPVWPGTVLVTVVAVVAVLGFARIRWQLFSAALAAPVGFLVIGALAVAISLGGTCIPDAWVCSGPVSVSRSSLIRAAGLFGHGVAGTAALLLLGTTTPMVDLITFLRQLRIPDSLLEVASLTYRLLFVMLATAYALHEAQVARLGDQPMGPDACKRRRHNSANVMGAVLIRSWDRARRLEDGLAGRGFENALTTLPVERRRSPAFLVSTVAVLIGIWTVSLLVAR